MAKQGDRRHVCILGLVLWVSKALIISFQNQAVRGKATVFLEQLKDSPIKKAPFAGYQWYYIVEQSFLLVGSWSLIKNIYYDSVQTLQKSLGNLKWIMLSSCFKTVLSFTALYLQQVGVGEGCRGRETEGREGASSEGWTLCPRPFLIIQRLLGWRKAEPREAAWGKKPSLMVGLFTKKRGNLRKEDLGGHLLQTDFLDFSRQTCSQQHGPLSLPLSTEDQFLLCHLFMARLTLQCIESFGRQKAGACFLQSFHSAQGSPRERQQPWDPACLTGWLCEDPQAPGLFPDTEGGNRLRRSKLRLS